MKTRSKLLALLGAAVLSLGIVGVAFAATPASDQGVVPTTVDPGNITLDGNGESDGADCDAADGIETGDESGSDTTANGVTVTWTYDDGTKEFGFSATGGLVTIAYVKGGNAYNIYDYTDTVDFPPDGGVDSDGNMFAPDTNDDGQPQGLSHAVFCTVAFEQETGGETDEPSEPSTDSLGTSGTSGPADGAWLLVVALGVLLASIVVLTPARAKSRR